MLNLLIQLLTELFHSLPSGIESGSKPRDYSVEFNRLEQRIFRIAVPRRSIQAALAFSSRSVKSSVGKPAAFSSQKVR